MVPSAKRFSPLPSQTPHEVGKWNLDKPCGPIKELNRPAQRPGLMFVRIARPGERAEKLPARITGQYVQLAEVHSVTAVLPLR